MKRILIINSSPLTDFDGKTLRLLRYAEALEEIGYNVDFLTRECRSLRLRDKYRVFEVPLPLEIIFEGKYRPILTEVSNALKLAHGFCGRVFNLVRNGDYTIVLSSFTTPELPTITAVIAAKIKDIPHVYDYDDLGPEMSQVMKGWTTIHPLYRSQLMLEKVICQHSDVIIAMSEMMRELLARTKSNDKMEVIHNAPPSAEFKAIEPIMESRKKLGVSYNSFVFAYLGSVQRKIRGLETLVEAVNILRNSGEDFLVMIIGSGTGETGLRRKVRHMGLSRYFIFTGEISKELAVSYLNAANVSLIILPSVQADYMAPTKLFISMALGKHIIASDSEQIHSILGYAPIYLKEHPATNEMAEAMLKAKEKFQDEDINKEYRNLFFSRYCWEKEKEIFVQTIEGLS